jgi:metal-responsive CopG/Arc/MetJ family transcriptional regulator
MKTAVSMPDDLFRWAEEFARRNKLSRSKLFSMAVAEYIARHRQDNITDQLNRVYGREDSSVDPVVQQIAARSLPKEKW